MEPGVRNAMTDEESWEMRLAWQEVWQVRGCPPEGVLRAGERSPELERHLALCSFCRECLEAPGLEGGRPGWPLPAPKAGGFRAPGEIWAVRRALGGWGPAGRYTNPPLVLIVRRPGEPREAVQVVQIHHEGALAGTGDVPLAGGLFAETWNAYALWDRDLEGFWGSVGEDILDAVHRAAANGWTASVRSLPPLLEAFRRLEIEVGAFCALRSITDLLASLERSASDRLLARFPDADALAAHVRRVHPGLVWEADPRKPLERLALAQFPDHELPLAAAGDSNWVLVHHVVWTPRGPDLVPGRAELTVRRAADAGIILGGRIEGSLPAGSELRVWWAVPERLPLPAAEVSYSPEGGFFRVRFQGLTEAERDQGRPLLLVCDPPDPAHPDESEP